MRYRVDRSVQVLDRGRQILGGSPLRLFTLSDAGQAVWQRMAAGDDVAANRLTRRLADAGAIHPQLDDAGPFSLDDVTFVVPAFGPLLVADLGPHLVVVDDASPSDRPVAPPHATVLRRSTNGGPGAARMIGLAEVTTPLVAFVDADVLVTAGWLERLLPHFADERVALVAPRVIGTDAASALARFEAVRSPLDLGDEPARVRAGTRVSYVPTAALVARTDAVRSVGGFDLGLRTGEDVDLVWRLVAAGYFVRYEPSATVQHETRATLLGWFRQRQGYGQSAGPLATRHPGALAPLRVSGWSVGVWSLAAIGHPVSALAVGAGTAVALARKLPTVPRRAAIDLVRYGHWGAGRQIASAITRTWWPLAVPLALVSRRARRVLVAAIVLPALADWRRTKPDLDPARYVALRALDDGAYGLGVWQGAWRSRTAEPLLPDFTSWPRPSRFERRLAEP